MRYWFASKRMWFGLIVGAVAASCVGVAIGSIGSGGTIHGCYQNSNGNLRVIDPTSAACRGGETALDWNVQGPQEPPGHRVRRERPGRQVRPVRPVRADQPARPAKPARLEPRDPPDRGRSGRSSGATGSRSTAAPVSRRARGTTGSTRSSSRKPSRAADRASRRRNMSAPD